MDIDFLQKLFSGYKCSGFRAFKNKRKENLYFDNFNMHQKNKNTEFNISKMCEKYCTF